MKLSPKMILAGMLLAGGAWAQPEQWLEYHTGSEMLSYKQITLTTNPPPGVALPKLNAAPFFARWLTPMDPAGGRWLCLDRSRKSGPYDRLFIDSTGNGRLDDKTPLQATTESYMVNFPPARMVFKGEDGPVTYHLVLEFYQYETNTAELLTSAGGWYEGMVNFDGVKKRLQLIDGNVNGAFNDIAPDPYDSDRVQVAGEKTSENLLRNSERFLGRMLEADGKLFRIEVARDGAFVKVQKAENVALGRVSVPTNISEISMFGENGFYERKPANGEFTVPAGKYRPIEWTINRKDEKGAAWSLMGYGFPKTSGFEAAADKSTALAIGEPVQAVLAATDGANHQVEFSLQFLGRQKESIQMLRGGERPAGPKLMLAKTDGTLCYTNTFEFG